jgi:drug/metabolite transporter (DMT)-like permease
MSNNQKIGIIAFLISFVGFIAAHNAKLVRDGVSPWWTAYIISFCTSSIYAYLARHPFFPLTYTSAFQTFFFHSSWYLTTILVIGESVSRTQIAGIGMILFGMIMMSIK